jgi:hypothetical protein
MEADKRGKIIVSFDIGIKNLACCVVEAATGSRETKILMWYVIALAEKKEKIPNVAELSLRLFAELDELMETLGPERTIDSVLIENQPSRINGTMKTVQMMIYSYFQLRRHWEGRVLEVLMVSAKGKLQGHEWCEKELPAAPVEKTGYELNKWRAVKIAECYIRGDERLEALFQSYNKKDDMSDAMLQCIAWLRKKKYDIEHCAYETI